MSATPEIGGRKPIPINVEAGKSYWWCACGRSKKQPFCDGSHKGTAFSPREFKAEKTEEAWFCACKRTAKQPMCDGSHKKLRRNARSSARILLRGNPGAHAGAGGGGSEEARHRQAGRGGPRLRGRARRSRRRGGWRSRSHGIPVRQPDVKEERKGPRVGAPSRRSRAFLKAAGLTSIEQAKIEKDPKKGDFYVARDREAGPARDRRDRRDRAGRGEAFPWPKSMRWGEASAQPGALNWVRPLHSIVATFGPETEEPEIVHVRGRRHRGGRHHATAIASWRPQPIKVKRLRRLRGQARKGQGRGRSGAARADDPDRREEPRLRAGLRAGRGRGAAGRGRGPGRMAGGADGLVRRGVPRRSPTR